jgi:riboflavin transport system substrate-binding protein
MKKRTMVIILFGFSLLLPLSAVAGGNREAEEAPRQEEVREPFSIAIFIPGVVAGSPLYEDLVAGTEKAASEYTHVSVKVLEGGFNQGEWAEKLTSLAAGDYDVIVTSNPAMPAVAAEVVENFPGQKFINLDGYLEGNPQIYTLMYNQVEQGYLVGFLGGLITKSSMEGANSALKAGLIVAQEYPVMEKMIKPGYEKGLRAVDPEIKLDYRVIGNWYDANKAADLANSMFDAGVDVVLTIAGSANQGTIKAAEERGKYVLYFDAEDYDLAPGTIAGCAVLRQDKAAYETVKKAIEGTLSYGTADVVHMKNGYVDFADDDPLYRQTVSDEVREQMGEVISKLRSGELVFQPPKF